MCLASTPSKLTPPFPHIFSQSLDAQGFLQCQLPPPGCRNISNLNLVSFIQPVFYDAIKHSSSTSAVAAPMVSSVPVMTSLQSGPALSSWLSELHHSTSAFDIRRVAPSFFIQGPEMADYQEAMEQLCLLAQCYRDDSDGVMRSSSEDDD